MKGDTVCLTRYELWYLFSQEPSGIIVGFRNPILGLLREDCFPLAQEAALAMLDKGLIEFDDAARLRLEGTLENLVSTIVVPQHTLLTAFKSDGSKREKVRSINFNGNRLAIVEELPDENYALYSLENKSDVVALIMEPFSSKMFRAPDSDALLVNQEEIFSIQEAVATGALDRVQILVERTEGDDQSKLDLLRAFKATQVNFTLICFFDRHDAQISRNDGFSVIADDHYVWLIDVVDEAKKLARVAKVTIKTLSQKISSMIPPMP